MSNFSPKPLAWPEFGCPITAWRGGEVRGKTPIQIVPLESVRDWRSRPPARILNHRTTMDVPYDAKRTRRKGPFTPRTIGLGTGLPSIDPLQIRTRRQGSPPARNGGGTQSPGFAGQRTTGLRAAGQITDLVSLAQVRHRPRPEGPGHRGTNVARGGKPERVPTQISAHQPVLRSDRFTHPPAGRVSTLGWTLRISSGVSKGIYESVVQSGRDFPYIRVGGGQ